MRDRINNITVTLLRKATGARNVAGEVKRRDLGVWMPRHRVAIAGRVTEDPLLRRRESQEGADERSPSCTYVETVRWDFVGAVRQSSDLP
jgi:hypothetical protein